MIIKTESGSRYELDDRKICQKFESEGLNVDTIKADVIRSVSKNVDTLEALKNARKYKEIKVGRRLYIAGTNIWWLSTEIVEIT
jgi:hypothetical protein